MTIKQFFTNWIRIKESLEVKRAINVVHDSRTTNSDIKLLISIIVLV